MVPRGDAATQCCFCSSTAEPLIASTRANAPDRAVCARCARSLKSDAQGTACDFCDHPSGAHAEADGVRICEDCLDLARDVVRDSEAPPSGPEGHLDRGALWSDLTPAPILIVDGSAPATVHADLAMAFLEMGLRDEARVEVGRALALDASHAIALRVRAKLES
jgi:hypothetical protein